MDKRRIIVGISGATGAQLGERFLEALAEIPEVETHLVLTHGAKVVIERETDMSVSRSITTLAPWVSTR